MSPGSTAVKGQTFDIEIDVAFRPYFREAALRLSYVEQSFSVAAVDNGFRVTARDSVDHELIVRRINHAVYREKIRAESAPLRARFLELLAQR